MKIKRLIFLFCLLLFGQMCVAQTFHLFDEDVKEQYPSVVYGFLERYLYRIDSLERSGQNVKQILRDDKVDIICGIVADAGQITSDMPFSMICDGKGDCEVNWIDSLGRTKLHIRFPMRYELLLGSSKNELERNLYERIIEVGAYSAKQYEVESLFQIGDSLFQTHPLVSYYLDTLNTTTYFSFDSERVFHPVYSDEKKEYSLKNLLQGIISEVPDYNITINQNIYNFDHLQYTISMKQWLAYCRRMNLTVYTAIEGENQNGITALIIAKSNELGFNHMMKLWVPNDFVNNQETSMIGELNAYIPIHNVKDLYQQFEVKKRKNI